MYSELVTKNNSVTLLTLPAKENIMAPANTASPQYITVL